MKKVIFGKKIFIGMIIIFIIVSNYASFFVVKAYGSRDEIDEQQLDHDEKVYLSIVYPGVSQTFIPDRDILSQMEIYGSNSYGSFYAGISEVQSLNRDDWLTYELINDIEGWTIVDFEDISVNPGSTYYLIITIKSNPFFTYIHLSDENPYPRGIMGIYCQGAGWYNVSSSDLAFKIWGYDNQPPYTPSNPIPYNGETGVDRYHNLYWDGGDPEGDTVYYKIWFGTDSTPDAGEVVVDFEDHYTSTTYEPGTLSYDTTYYWKVQGQDEHGATGSSSNVWHFTTEGEPNDPPETPSTPSGPTSGYHGSSYQYSTSTTDPEDDDVYYKWDWGDGDVSGWIGPCDSGETCYVSHSWDEPGTYYVKVKARDVYYHESGWSYSLEVYMGNRAPNTPSTPSGPISGWHGVEYQYSVVAIDPDGDDVFYKWDWGDGEFSGWLGPYNSGEACYASHVWDWPDTFQLRVKVKDEYDVESSWSNYLVVTMGNRNPDVPHNPDPENYATWVDIETYISWECDDPDGDDLLFDIYFENMNPPSLLKENHMGTSFYPGPLDPDEPYFWKIVARDNYEGFSEGPVWRFTTRVYNSPNLSTYAGWSEGVDREWGRCMDPFVFKVHYYDSDQDPAVVKNLVVDDVCYEMNGSGWDSDYSLTVDGGVFGGGFHEYFFEFEDGTVSPGARLPESGFWGFTVNYPPNTPDLSGPTELEKNVVYSFFADTDDQDLDEVRYRFDWGDGSNLFVTDLVPSGTEVKVNHSWSSSGSFIFQLIHIPSDVTIYQSPLTEY